MSSFAETSFFHLLLSIISTGLMPEFTKEGMALACCASGVDLIGMGKLFWVSIFSGGGMENGSIQNWGFFARKR